MINIGDTIYLELEDPGKASLPAGKKAGKYRCKLIDRKKDLLVIDLPVDEETNKTVFFMKGIQMQAWFVGKDQAVYMFETEVKGKHGRKIRSLLITEPGEEQYVRIQRRNYVRINASVNTAVHPAREHSSPFITSTEDISGGGMAVLLPSNHTLQENDNVLTWIVLQQMDGTIQYINISCVVIRIMNEEGRLKDRCSLRFEHIKETDRQNIIKYCFEQQLQMRRSSKSRNR
ncbi:flagellar brake protein [Salibacterium aidingense]|uniref:flagellar brake protein n=1 Tax=Salibacterium aidingense TaxID=384933 RepID=UPI000415DBC7|nr:flagellar brake domain-containing protein [Salibacterium aidingense]